MVSWLYRNCRSIVVPFLSLSRGLSTYVASSNARAWEGMTLVRSNNTIVSLGFRRHDRKVQWKTLTD